MIGKPIYRPYGVAVSGLGVYVGVGIGLGVAVGVGGIGVYVGTNPEADCSNLTSIGDLHTKSE